MEAETIFEEILVGNILNVIANSPLTWDSQQTQKEEAEKTQSYTIIKLLKIRNKEKTLIATRENRYIFSP